MLMIISDIHLGTPNSQTRQLLYFLTYVALDRLIINGDLLDSLDLRRFGENDWKVINRLQELARQQKLLVIWGNHDYDPASDGSRSVLPLLLKTPIVKSIPVEVGDKQYLVMHGDYFDWTLNWKIITRISDNCYYQIQKLGASGAWLKHTVKRMAGVVHGVPKKAADYVKGCYAGVILGHTHHAADYMINDVHYMNSGCWTEPTCSYIMINDGKIKLCRWPR